MSNKPSLSYATIDKAMNKLRERGFGANFIVAKDPYMVAATMMQAVQMTPRPSNNHPFPWTYRGVPIWRFKDIPIFAELDTDNIYVGDSKEFFRRPESIVTISPQPYTAYRYGIQDDSIPMRDLAVEQEAIARDKRKDVVDYLAEFGCPDKRVCSSKC